MFESELVVEDFYGDVWGHVDEERWSRLTSQWPLSATSRELEDRGPLTVLVDGFGECRCDQ